VLAILDVYPLRRLGGSPGRWLGPSARRVWLEKLPFVLASLVFAGLAVAAKAEDRSLIPLREGGLAARVAQACYGAWFYLVKTAVPLELTAFYPLPEPIDWRAPRFLLSIIATLAVTVGLILGRRRWPGLLAAWLSYLVLLGPSSGLIRIGYQVAADRYSYLPTLGAVALLAAGLGRPWASPGHPRLRVVAIAAAGAAILGLVVLSRDQCRIWRSSEALWSHALAHGGNSRTANYGLATVRYFQGRFAEAMAHYDEAIRLAPEDSVALNDRAMILAACPDPRFRDGEAAVASATRACELAGWRDPGYLDTLAAAYAEAGDFAAAAATQEKAIGLLTDERVKADFRSRLALYRAGKPYRTPPPTSLPARPPR
jgi:tetratricopeptide (TPR) repeat protein